MKNTALGGSGVDVSEICLGAMYFGTKTGKQTSCRILDAYAEAGGTFLDTANIYARWIPGFSGGESETLLGEWMRARWNRSRLFIATKAGFEYPGVERGLRSGQIRAECEKSLKRLDTDVIDLFYAHVDDRATPLEESLQAMHSLVKEGKVRFIGASNFRAWRLGQAAGVARNLGIADYCCIQQRFTYVQPNPLADFGPQIAANDDLFDYCRVHRIAVLAYSPLLSGAYARRDAELPAQYVSSVNNQRLEALRTVAEMLGKTRSQIVLAWMLARNPRVIPVIGASSVGQLTENLGAADIRLDESVMSILDGNGRA